MVAERNWNHAAAAAIEPPVVGLRLHESADIYVHLAVSDLPLVGDANAYVHEAVRASQIESAARAAAIAANNSAAPGYDSLLDPFGLSNPGAMPPGGEALEVLERTQP